MGVIQQGINQLLRTTAIAAKLSPELEHRRELKESKEEQKKIVEQNKAINEAGGEVTKEQKQKLQNQLEKEFELNPTPETYKLTQIMSNYDKKVAKLKEEDDRRLQAEYEAQIAEYEAEKAEYEAEKSRGQLRAENKGLKQLKGKRNFSEYLSKIETNYGFTVGEFPKSVQKIIAKQYSSKERKQIMDKMDKEDKK